jgi:hypothetical protein
MHLRILPDHQKLFFKKDIFDRLEWLKTCFDAFSHTSRSPESFFQKRYFLPPGMVKSVFWCISTYFQTNRNFFSKEIFFTVWSGYKRVLMHFRILPYHQKPFFRKDIFYCLEWLKTCFYAFAHTFRSPETFFQKRYFLLSGVVKNVFLCICAYFQTTRNFFQKRYFWPSGVVKNMFWCISAYL